MSWYECSHLALHWSHPPLCFPWGLWIISFHHLLSSNASSHKDWENMPQTLALIPCSEVAILMASIDKLTAMSPWELWMIELQYIDTGHCIHCIFSSMLGRVHTTRFRTVRDRSRMVLGLLPVFTRKKPERLFWFLRRPPRDMERVGANCSRSIASGRFCCVDARPGASAH